MKKDFMIYTKTGKQGIRVNASKETLTLFTDLIMGLFQNEIDSIEYGKSNEKNNEYLRVLI